jgi:Tol biopolymer transport system component
LRALHVLVVLSMLQPNLVAFAEPALQAAPSTSETGTEPIRTLELPNTDAQASSSSQVEPPPSLDPPTQAVSINSAGETGNDYSREPVISADGRFVAFESWSSDLVPGDTNDMPDIFVRDLQAGETRRVSVASDGTEADFYSFSPTISGDGHYVAFSSAAANLVEEDTNDAEDVFLHYLERRETHRISTAADGSQGDGPSYGPVLSDDGRIVLFTSAASNLVEGDENGYTDLFLYEVETEGITRLIEGHRSLEEGLSFLGYDISSDGRYVAFASDGPNLVDGDENNFCYSWASDFPGENNCYDVFLHDRVQGETRLISWALNGQLANEASALPAISADGRYVVYLSYAANLVADDQNNAPDVFRYDRESGETQRVSLSTDGRQPNNHTDLADISADGRYVTFSSYATNLIAGDNSDESDIYIRDMMLARTRRVSLTAEGEEADGSSFSPTISADGHRLAFQSAASNLVDGDENGQYDAFVTEWGDEPPPVNDEIDSAVEIGTLPFGDSLNTMSASRAADDPPLGCAATSPTQGSNSVWYRYTPTEGGDLAISTTGSDYDTVLGVWTGEPGALEPLACSDDHLGQAAALTLPAQAGTTYWIEVTDYGRPTGGQLELSIDHAPPPAHDSFEAALGLETLPFAEIISTVPATTSADDPDLSCSPGGAGPGSNSIWYQHTPAASGALEISAHGRGYDTAVALWAQGEAGLTEVACEVQTESEGQRLTGPVTGGTTYWIEVVGVGDPPGGMLSVDVEFGLDNGWAQGLRGEYFANGSLEGEPLLTRYGEQVDFDWSGAAVPKELQADYFSARWQGRLQVGISGTYRFWAESRGGVRLWLDGELVEDSWEGGAGFGIFVDLEVDRLYELELEYTRRGPSPYLRLIWYHTYDPQSTTIPLSNLSYRDLGASSVQVGEPLPLADGISTSQVTVRANGESGGPYADLPVELQVSGGGNLLNGQAIQADTWIPIGETEENGEVSASLASTVAEEKVIRARVERTTLDATATVQFVTGEVAGLQILRLGETATPGVAPGKSGSPEPILVDQPTQFTVRAVDEEWNLVPTLEGELVVSTSDSNAQLPDSIQLLGGEATVVGTWSDAGTSELHLVHAEDDSILGEIEFEVLDALVVSAGEEVTTDLARYPLGARLEAGDTSVPYDGTGGFFPGSELLIMAMLGEEIGTYETVMVDRIEDGSLTLAEPLANDYDGEGGKVIVQRVPWYPRLEVQDGGVLTAHAWDGETGGVIFFRAGEVDVQAGGSIEASELGFRAEEGPGSSASAWYGAGHGGYGAGQRGQPYGLADAPAALGSAGCDDRYSGSQLARGGGAVHILVDGDLTLDGDIRARGSENCAGAGGGVWLEATALRGAGLIQANGAGDAGGAGGRIAVYAEMDAFTGELQAFGGGEDEIGGAATIYVLDIGSDWTQILVDNNGKDGPPAVISNPQPTDWAFDEIEILRSGQLEFSDLDDTIPLQSAMLSGDGSGMLHAHSDVGLDEPELNAFGLSIYEGATLTLPGEFSLNQVRIVNHGGIAGLSSLTVHGGSFENFGVIPVLTSLGMERGPAVNGRARLSAIGRSSG